MPSKRLDVCLVEQDLASGREKAKELILSGVVTVNGKAVRKAAFLVAETDRVSCENDGLVYVSRGALKLEKALQLMSVDLTQCIAMDVGASTGGFTQCLLQHGTDRVYAVDVGHGQLHDSLRGDPRVVNLEGTDVRDPRLLQTIGEKTIDVLTADVSFISLRQILPSVLPFLKDEARLILLIKPQFEAGKADVGKNGIVRNRAVHVRVLRELTTFLVQSGCSPLLLTGSPITGGAGRKQGNIEYLTVLAYDHAPIPPVWDFRRIVDETFDAFALSEV